MKTSEIRGMALNEAEEKVLALKAELAKERAVLASGTRPENPGRIRSLRRNIARIFTIMAEKKKTGEKKIQENSKEKNLKNNKKILKKK